MGHFSKSQKPPSIILFLLLSFLLIPASTQLKSNDEEHISVVISKMGIDFIKDLLIKKAVSAIIPLKLPDIKKSCQIPLLGKVEMILSNITINGVDIGTSYVKMGYTDSVVLVVSGVTASLSMNWEYSYCAWLLPIDVSKSGSSSVLVEGMEMRLSVALENEGGRIKLYLLNYGSNVKDITINMDGSPSWIDFGIIKAFKGKIMAAIEDSVSMKSKEEIFKLDSLLQSLPRKYPVDKIASVDLSFVNNPLLTDSSVEFGLNGLFTTRNSANSLSKYHQNGTLLASAACNGQSKMIRIALHEDVIVSAASVYFNANDYHWVIDKTRYQSFLNTAEWRYVFPRLYRKYPDDDMKLNISMNSPPIIQIVEHNIDITVSVDMTIDVIHDRESLSVTDDDSHRTEIVPVAGITMVISSSCTPGVSRNRVVSSIRLVNFSAYLKWSTIGDFDMYLLQPVLSSIIQTVFLPSVNSRLRSGIPLPIPQGLTLRNAQTFCADSTVVICSDLALSY